jgi:hypothetical protein
VKLLLKAALLLAAMLVAYFTLPAIGAVNHRTLHTSVARAVGGDLMSSQKGCRRAEGAWRCEVAAFQGDSGGTVYTVRKRGRRCWTAVSTRPAPELPSLAKGCAKLREQGRWGRRVSEILP